MQFLFRDRRPVAGFISGGSVAQKVSAGAAGDKGNGRKEMSGKSALRGCEVCWYQGRNTR